LEDSIKDILKSNSKVTFNAVGAGKNREISNLQLLTEMTVVLLDTLKRKQKN
jgi:hypothetical protein